MRKLGIYVSLLLLLVSLSVVNLVHTVAKTLPSCVSICDETGDAHGAGFIAAKGCVVTARHITEAFADEGLDVYVKFNDGRMRKVTKVIPLKVDIAVLRLYTGKRPPARLGDSDRLEPAQPVFAVGAPYGLEQSVTAGIISALHRNFTVTGTDYENAIQTSGLVHPGDSGGPLLDAQGRVVGINVVAINNGGGIGFAVPINQVKERTGLH